VERGLKFFTSFAVKEREKPLQIKKTDAIPVMECQISRQSNEMPMAFVLAWWVSEHLRALNWDETEI
jgi:hypothetical protein